MCYVNQIAMNLLMILILFGSVKTKKCDIKGYYWRDFKGDIPEDAFPGGKDAKGNPFYIGQIFLSKVMLPGKIFPGDVNVYVTSPQGKAISESINVKILCSLRQKQMQWEASTFSALEEVNEELIRGGSDHDDIVYIGRQAWKGEIQLGWIPFRKNINERLLRYYTNDSGVQYTYRFEVLLYDSEE